MERIGKYMTASPHTIGANQTLAVAHRMMRQHLVRHLPVLERGEIVGMVSQRDLYFIETLRGVDIDVVTVNEAMAADPYLVSVETPLAEVAATMAERKLGSAVVVDDGDVVGVFTSTDAMRLLAAKMRHPSPRGPVLGKDEGAAGGASKKTGAAPRKRHARA